jgi:hypothetical protein
MKRLFVVYGESGRWFDPGGWNDLDAACVFTSIAKARAVARRNEGTVYELVPTLLKTPAPRRRAKG